MGRNITCLWSNGAVGASRLDCQPDLLELSMTLISECCRCDLAKLRPNDPDNPHRLTATRTRLVSPAGCVGGWSTFRILPVLRQVTHRPNKAMPTLATVVLRSTACNSLSYAKTEPKPSRFRLCATLPPEERIPLCCLLIGFGRSLKLNVVNLPTGRSWSRSNAWKIAHYSLSPHSL